MAARHAIGRLWRHIGNFDQWFWRVKSIAIFEKDLTK
jgi:hypothetical protein